MNEHEILRKEIKEQEDKIEELIAELKYNIKRNFWLAKGYPRLSTQNYQIVEEGIEYGIDAMRKSPPTQAHKK